MITIPVKVKKRIITCKKAIVEDNVDTYRVQLNLDEEWDDFSEVTRIIFYNDHMETGDQNPKDVLVSSSEVVIPWEVLSESGNLYLTLVGEMGSKRIITQIMSSPIVVSKSGLANGTDPTDPTPSVVELIVTTANEAKEVAQSVRDDADAGKFIGPQGPKGDKGDKGDDGAQADWKESNVNSSSYVKNRPFYSESKTYDSFPDADYTTPAYDIPDEVTLYKISDTPFKETDFVGAVMVYHELDKPDERQTTTLTDDDFRVEPDKSGNPIFAELMGIYYIIYSQYPLDESTAIEPGIYFMLVDTSIVCLDSIEFITKVVKVPTMYLPDKDYYNMTESDKRYVSKQNNDYESFENLCLEFHNLTDLTGLFSGSDFKRAPRVSTAYAETIALMYRGCQHVKSIYSTTSDFAFELPRIKEGGFDYTFSGCYSLVDIRFRPNNIEYNISFTSSPYLSDKSIQSIINGLDTVTVSRTVRFHPLVIEKLTDAQLKTISDKNWNVG